MLSAYDYWQFWRNTEDADVGRFLQAVHRRCRWTRSPGWKRSAAPRSTRRRRSWRPRRPPCCMAATRPKEPPRRRARPSRRAYAADTLADRRGRRRRVASGIGVLSAFVQRGPRRLDGRSAPADQGRRPAPQRCAADRRARSAHAGRPAAQGAVKLSLGRKKHVLLKPR